MRLTKSPIFNDEKHIVFDSDKEKPCSYCAKTTHGKHSSHTVIGLGDGTKIEVPLGLPLCSEACLDLWISASSIMYSYCSFLRRYKYTHGTEKVFQDGIEKALIAEGVKYEREHRLSDKDIIDFFLPNLGVGIEVKIKGSFSQFVRQIQRYSKHEQIKAIILASCSARTPELPSAIQGKPATILRLYSL